MILRLRKKNPDLDKKVLKCSLCKKKIVGKDTFPYAPFSSLVGWRKSKFTIEFVDRSHNEPRDASYMDVCEQCFSVVTKRMKDLHYFTCIADDDKHQLVSRGLG
ncbi:MAG: hypothetical protein QXR60_03780 [Candidatus Nanoarchaeia archaeon]